MPQFTNQVQKEVDLYNKKVDNARNKLGTRLFKLKAEVSKNLESTRKARQVLEIQENDLTGELEVVENAIVTNFSEEK